MKVWWVLAWDHYYPRGGLNNVDSCWETEEEALKRANDLKVNGSDDSNDFTFDYITVENISRRLWL